MNWFWILVCLPLLCLVVEAGNPDAKRLYDDLLSNYNKLVRPVVNVSEAVTVRLKLKLSQLIDVVSALESSMYVAAPLERLPVISFIVTSKVYPLKSKIK